MKVRASGPLTYQNMKFSWPYGDVRLNQLEMIHQLGEHAQLKLTCYIATEYEEAIVNRSSSDDLIKLWYIQDDGLEVPLFMGQLHSVEILNIHNDLYAIIEVISHSFKLDTKLKNRSFQQVNRTYIDVFKEILNDYKDSDMLDGAFGDLTIGKFIMQYQETDWTFLKRLASHIGAVLVPNITDHRLQVWIGVPQGRSQIKLENAPHRLRKRIESYVYYNANTQSETTPEDYTVYSFEWVEILQLGDEVNHNGKSYVITRRTGSMVSGVMIWSYECGLQKGLTVAKKYNQRIIGAAIEGKILEVRRNQVRIHLDLDKQQDPKGIQWFPYSAEGSQVWYLMPEKGSQVKLYFPSADEDDAMVIQSVRKEPEQNLSKGMTGESPGERYYGKMIDPGVKSFSNPQGKEVTLGDAELNISAQEGMLYVSMNSVNGVSFNSTTSIQIQATEGLNLSASKITLKGERGLDFSTMFDTLEIGEEINGLSPEMLLSGSVHTTYEKILSPFEQTIAERGILLAVADQTLDNIGATLKGEWDAGLDYLKGLGNFVVDIGDILLTSKLSDDKVSKVYSFFSGKEVEPLYLRNDTFRGTAEGLISTGKYAMDVVTLKKSFGEMWKDGKGAFNSYSAPFVEKFQNFIPNPITDTKEESYRAGVNSVEAAGRALDTAGIVAGGAGLVKNAPKILSNLRNISNLLPDIKINQGQILNVGSRKLKTNAMRLPKDMADIGDWFKDVARKMNQENARSLLAAEGGRGFDFKSDPDYRYSIEGPDRPTSPERQAQIDALKNGEYSGTRIEGTPKAGTGNLIKDSSSYKELAKNHSADDLIKNLEGNGWTKVVDPPRSARSGEAIKFTNPDNGDVIRIMPNPADGKPYFKVQNKGGGWLDEFGNFPSNATKQELRDLTHFYFEK